MCAGFRDGGAWRERPAPADLKRMRRPDSSRTTGVVVFIMVRVVMCWTTEAEQITMRSKGVYV